jgi:hypothetical protein
MRRRQGDRRHPGRVFPDPDAEPIVLDFKFGEPVFAHEIEKFFELLEIQSVGSSSISCQLSAP